MKDLVLRTKHTKMAAAGRLIAKGRQFRLVLPQDGLGDLLANNIEDRYSAQRSDTVESSGQSVDITECQNAAGQIHQNELKEEGYGH